MKVEPPRVLAHSWLLLIHQLPAKPAYLRVKIWRRLQDIGAIAVKNAVHALPMNEETQEDFEWLLREIREGGGEAFVCEARLIDGLSDEEVRTLFDRARDADYAELTKEAQGLSKSQRRKGSATTTRAALRPPSFVPRSLDCANGLPRLPRSISSAPSGAKRRKSCSQALKLS
jgi:hypothetical protein